MAIVNYRPTWPGFTWNVTNKAKTPLDGEIRFFTGSSVLTGAQNNCSVMGNGSTVVSALPFLETIRVSTSANVELEDLMVDGNSVEIYNSGGVAIDINLGTGAIPDNYSLGAGLRAGFFYRGSAWIQQWYNTIEIVDNGFNVENIYAKDSNGLSLLDDGGNLGVFIDDGGNVGIKTSTPGDLLEVNNQFIVGTNFIGIGGKVDGNDRDCYNFYASDAFRFWDESDNHLKTYIVNVAEFKVTTSASGIGGYAGSGNRNSSFYFATDAPLDWIESDDKLLWSKLFHITRSSSPALFVERTVTSDGISTPLQLHIKNSNNMGDGIGSAIQFSIEDNAAVQNVIGRIIFQRAGADNTGDCYINCYNAGSPQNNIVIDGSTGSIGIQTATPHATALIHMVSTSQGLKPPGMTGAQVEAIGSPLEGIMVYATSAGSGDITSKGMWYYNGSNWIQM